MPAPALTPPAKSPAQLEAEAFAAEQDRLQKLRAAQNAHARARHLDKLARRDPTVRDFLDEQAALVSTLALLREKLAAATAVTESQETALAAKESELVALREQLAQALKARK